MGNSTQTNATQPVIPRRLVIGINADSYDELPKIARNLNRFLKSVDHDPGPFELDVAVSVNPILGAPSPTAAFDDGGGDQPPVVGFYVESEDDDDDYDEEEVG